MFGGSSNNKNKRRSFFLFGSDSKIATAPIKTLEKSVKGTILNGGSGNHTHSSISLTHDSTEITNTKHTSHRTHTSSTNTSQSIKPRPLSKSPLMNFGEETKSKKSSERELSVSKSETKLNSIPGIERPSQHRSISETSHTTQRVPSIAHTIEDPVPSAPIAPVRNKARRPPPPIIDMNAAVRSIEHTPYLPEIRESSSTLNDQTKSQRMENRVPSVETDGNILTEPILPTNSSNYIETSPFAKPQTRNVLNTNEISNDIVSNTSIPATLQVNTHRRQKSEAESLVDDLDVYIREYREKSKSIEDLIYQENNGNESINNMANEPGQSIYSQNTGSSNKLNIGPITTSFDHLNISEQPSAESSLIYVSPLDVQTTPLDDGKFSRNTLTIANVTTNGSTSSSDDISGNHLDNKNIRDNDNSSSDSSSHFSFSNSVTENADTTDDIHFENDHSSELQGLDIDYPQEQDDTNIPIDIPDISIEDQQLSTMEGTSDDKVNDVFRQPSSHYEDSSFDTTIETYKSTDTDYSNEYNNQNYTGNNFGDNYTGDTADDAIIQTDEPRRNFRIANEDHPTFYIKDDISTTDNDASTIQTTETEKEHENENIPLIDDVTYDSPTSPLVPIPQTVLPPDMTVFQSDSSTKNKSISTLPSGNSTDNITLTSGEKSLKSSQSLTGTSLKSTEKTSKLVSGYVEELRLKYFQTSNFLQAPPNLPLALKQKNNLIQPKNIKVKIRTNTKQVGIKHGRVKQKLLSFETNGVEDKSMNFKKGRNNNNAVDHTKEFHDFFNKENSQLENTNIANIKEDGSGSYPFDSESVYMKEIPGDEAYNSDDIMAPLREKKGANSVTRNNTVVSYYTRSKNRMDESTDLPDLPTNIPIERYKSHKKKSADSKTEKGRSRSDSGASINTQLLTTKVSGIIGLHVANPDSDSE